MKCPVCGSEYTQSYCPVCGIEKLDQVFMTLKDKEKWIREVVIPFRQRYGKTVIVGGNTYLCLADNQLWGWGGNSTKQLSQSGRGQIEDPILIAQNVISACAILNYIVYITSDGKLHYQGSDSNGIFDQIQKINSHDQFAHVYGDYAENSIVLTFADRSRKSLFLGQNDGRLVQYKEIVRRNIHYRYTKRETTSISGYHHTMIEPWPDDLPEFIACCNRYGKNNCHIEKIQDNHVDEAVALMTVDNKVICEPEVIESELDSNYLWNGLPRKKDSSCQGPWFNEWSFKLDSHQYVFKHDIHGDLQISRDGTTLRHMSGIMSFAMNPVCLVLVDMNGSVFYGETNRFIQCGMRILGEAEIDRISGR